MGLIISPSTVQVQDEASPLGSVNTLNFVGPSVTATVSNGVATITDTAMSLGLAVMVEQTNYNL
jgi:hypothetical protein